MILTIDVKWEIGETIYLKTDMEQLPRLVYGYYIDKGEVVYRIANGINTSQHFDFEITEEKNVLV